MPSTSYHSGPRHLAEPQRRDIEYGRVAMVQEIQVMTAEATQKTCQITSILVVGVEGAHSRLSKQATELLEGLRWGQETLTSLPVPRG